MSISWNNIILRLRADVQDRAFTTLTVLLLIVTSAVDLLEIPQVFHPIVASRVFPFFHEIHDLLTVAFILFIAYRKRTYLAYVTAMFYVVLHIPYFLLSTADLPEYLRIIFTSIIGSLGAWLIDNIYGKLSRRGRRRGIRTFSRIGKSEGKSSRGRSLKAANIGVLPMP